MGDCSCSYGVGRTTFVCKFWRQKGESSLQWFLYLLASLIFEIKARSLMADDTLCAVVRPQLLKSWAFLREMHLWNIFDSVFLLSTHVHFTSSVFFVLFFSTPFSCLYFIFPRFCSHPSYPGLFSFSFSFSFLSISMTHLMSFLVPFFLSLPSFNKILWSQGHSFLVTLNLAQLWLAMLIPIY